MSKSEKVSKNFNTNIDENLFKIFLRKDSKIKKENLGKKSLSFIHQNPKISFIYHLQAKVIKKLFPLKKEKNSRIITKRIAEWNVKRNWQTMMLM
jgi:hypothetical protein